MTRELQQRTDGSWTQPWPKKLVEKARRNEYIDLTGLRQEAASKDPQAKQDIPGGQFQLVYQGPTTLLTSIVEWSSLYHNYLTVLEEAGNKWGLHQAIKNGRFCHGLIASDKYTWQSIIRYLGGSTLTSGMVVSGL